MNVLKSFPFHTFSQSFHVPYLLVPLPSRHPIGTTVLPEAQRSTGDQISHASGFGPGGILCLYCGPALLGTRCPPLCKHKPNNMLMAFCFYIACPQTRVHKLRRPLMQQLINWRSQINNSCFRRCCVYLHISVQRLE